MANVQTCFSPALFPLFNAENSIVVVIDVLRATSAICTAFEHGVQKLIPVATVEEALAYKKNGFMAGAERDGKVSDGFEFGNSPYSYMNEKIKGKTIVLSTTNGTKAIHAAKHSYKVIIGSFINFNAVVDFLGNYGKDVVLLCAGWKDRFNMEDSLFAGAVVRELMQKYNFTTDCDSSIAMSKLFTTAESDLYTFLDSSSHRLRLRRLELEQDIKYCLKPNQSKIIPILEGNYLVKLV